MIFGRKERNKYLWHTVFVFWPKHLIDGRWAMLQKVERISWWSHLAPKYAPSSIFDWCYREIKAEK